MDDLISRAAVVAKVEKARKAARTLTGMDFIMVVKDIPAVDAVPVEWLKEKTRNPDNHTQASAKWMLGCWKREQEAR